MFRIGILLAIAAIGLQLGCKRDKTPEVCDHIRELLSETLKYDVTEENYDRCIAEMSKIREEDSERARRVESCVLAARTLETISVCGF